MPPQAALKSRAKLPAHRVLIAAGVFRLRLALAGQRLGRGFAGPTGWRASHPDARRAPPASAKSLPKAHRSAVSSVCLCCPGGRRRHCAAGAGVKVDPFLIWRRSLPGRGPMGSPKRGQRTPADRPAGRALRVENARLCPAVRGPAGVRGNQRAALPGISAGGAARAVHGAGRFLQKIVWLLICLVPLVLVAVTLLQHFLLLGQRKVADALEARLRGLAGTYAGWSRGRRRAMTPAGISRAATSRTPSARCRSRSAAASRPCSSISSASRAANLIARVEEVCQQQQATKDRLGELIAQRRVMLDAAPELPGRRRADHGRRRAGQERRLDRGARPEAVGVRPGDEFPLPGDRIFHAPASRSSSRSSPRSRPAWCRSMTRTPASSACSRRCPAPAIAWPRPLPASSRRTASACSSVSAN